MNRDGIKPDTTDAKIALRCIRRIDEVGYQKWLDEEVDSPSWSDEAWKTWLMQELSIQPPPAG